MYNFVHSQKQIFIMKLNLQTIILKVFVAFALLITSLQGNAQTTVSYTAMTTITCPATPVATISTPPTGLTFSQISRGSGVTCGTAGGSISGSGFNGTLAANIAASKWYTFTITSNASTAFTLNSLSIVGRVSAVTSGNNVSVQYRIDGGALTAIGSYTPTTGAATYLVTPAAAIAVGAGKVLSIFIIPNGLNASTTTSRVENATSVNVTATAAAVAPTVTTTATAAGTITNNAAVLAGNVTATGGDGITGNGSVYSLTATNNDPLISGTGVTNLSTTSPGASTGAFANNTGAVLLPNTQYTHKAYAINTKGTSYGSAVSFYTHANTPTAPTVGGATPNSLQVTIGAGDSNPAITEYAIEIGTGSYVQANGASTGSAVWQTAAAWGTKTVTGLFETTLYSFKVYARNASGVITEAGDSATGTTTANTSPTLTAGAMSEAFGAICVGTSSIKSFDFHGTNLESNVTIGSLEGFTFSTTIDGNYESSLSLIPDSGNEIDVTIYVKFSPTVVQSYSATPISITGGGAAPTSVTVNAFGVNTPVSVVTTLSGSSSITATSAVLAASYTVGCSAVIATGIEYSINSNLTSSTQATGTFPLTLSGLSPNTLYYYRAYATDETGTVNGNILSFTTLQLSAPSNFNTTLIGQNAFTANWSSVAGATSYRLDVSTSPTFSTSTNGNITENFTEYVNGTTSYNGFTLPSTSSTYTTATSSGPSGPKSFQFNTNGQIVLTPVLAGPATQLSFWARNNSWSGGTLVIEGYNGTQWVAVQTIASASILTTGGPVGGSTFTYNATSTPALPANITQFRFTFNKPSSGNLAFDDLSINYGSSTASFVAPYNNFTVNGTSQLVQNLSPATDYYYRVRAVSANSTSASSTPAIKVTTAAAPPTFGAIQQASGTSCSGTDVTFTLSGLVELSKSTISYSINDIPQTPIENVTALGDGTATIQINLTTANNGQSLVITAIERTDFEAEVFNPTSGNSVIINNISALVIYYADADGDGYGVSSPEIPSCTGVPTYLGHPAVTNTTDCAPNNPLAWRLGDFYVDADNDTFFDGNPVTTEQCYGNTTPTGYVSLSDNKGTDCDDTKGEVNSNHVEVLANGIDDNCDEVIDEVAPTTSLVATHCGSTLSNITNTLFANQVPSAQGYRFEISINGTNPRYYDSPTYYFNMLNIPGGVLYNTTYTVRVAVKTNDFWRAYSTTCLVTTPAVPATTNVGPAQCGITLTDMATTIFAVQVTSANQYRFEVSDGVSPARTYDSAVNRFSFAALGGLSYNTTYSVRVALRFGSTWQDYGTACNITTPETPRTSNVIPSLCGTTISNGWTTIYAMQVPEATGYRFNVTAPGVSRFYDTPNNRFSLRNIPSFTVTPNTTYTITVQILYNGFYQAAGSACTITTAGVVTRQAETAVSVFDVKAYPNPYADTFKLDMNTSGEDTVEVKVYDMIGRQMEATTLNVSDLDTKEIGVQYPSGVYNIIVTQGENVKTLRVIKR